MRILFLCCFFSLISLQSMAQIDTLPEVADDLYDSYHLEYHTFEKEHFLQVTLMNNDAVAHDAVGRKLFYFNDEGEELIFNKGVAISSRTDDEGLILTKVVQKEGSIYQLNHLKGSSLKVKHIPLWLSILPPILAILLALFLREVMVSLFAGIWMGAFVLNGLTFKGLFVAVFEVINIYVVQALTDEGHVAVIVFSMLIGAMVAVISRNGGMAGVVDKLGKYARSSRSSQLITWFLGIAIFFDDYANTLIVGNTMRPVTDKYKVSREKLAYIVDSTAAPIAAVAFISTWIGAELGYIDAALDSAGLDRSAYDIFLNSLRYSFYPFLTLIFMLALIWFKRDFGPMAAAELKSRMRSAYPGDEDGKIEKEDIHDELTPVEGISNNWLFAVVPIFTLISVVLARLLFTGGFSEELASNGTFKALQNAIGNADSYSALLWGSIGGLLMAAVMSFGFKKLSLMQTADSILMGFKTMMPAVIILVLAWGLASITEHLHTSAFLISITPKALNPVWYPMIFLILAALIAFSTGSSWGTMAILYPLCLPLTLIQSEVFGLPADEMMEVLFNVTSVILAGSVLGDHCSPISDTTILSSLASNCKHIDHVKTQLPYALSVGVVSILVGGVGFALGLPWYLGYVIGIVLVFAIVWTAGKELAE